MAKRKRRKRNPVGELSDVQFDRLNDVVIAIEKLSNNVTRLASHMPSPVSKMLEKLDERLEASYEEIDEWITNNT